MKSRALEVLVSGSSAVLASGLMLTASGAFGQVVAGDEQATSRNAGVLDRARPDYDAVGIRAGSFLILPKATTTVDASDNILASHTNTVSDTVILFQPEVTMRSNWSRNMLEVYGRAAFSAYGSNSSQNATEAEVRASGRYDIAEGSNLNGGLGYAYMAEPRYLATAQAQNGNLSTSSGPEHYTLLSAHAGAVQAMNRVRLTETVQFADYRYEGNALTFGVYGGEKTRDRTEVTETGRAELAVSPDTSVFVQGDLNQRSYRLGPPQAVLNRDSNGYDVTVGARLDLTHLVRGEFRIGYLNQDYDSAAFKSVSGLSLSGRFDYFVTPLTTVTVTADRSVGDAADPRSSGYITTNGGVEVDHELRRNIILTGRAFVAHDDYRGIDRTDDRWTARVGGTWLVNRMVGVGLFFDHIDVGSKGTAAIPDYTVNQILLSLVIQR